jgi:hypothetical protein
VAKKNNPGQCCRMESVNPFLLSVNAFTDKSARFIDYIWHSFALPLFLQQKFRKEE